MENEIAHSCVSSWGTDLYYCEACVTGKYCKQCDRVLAADDDDRVCYDCAEYACYDCSEVLNASEVTYSFVDEWGDLICYCQECDTGEYCPDCSRVIYEYADGECWYCS